jgi:hypothetical protein
MDHDPSQPPPRGGVRRSLAELPQICTIFKSPLGGFRGSEFSTWYFISHVTFLRAIILFTEGQASSLSAKLSKKDKPGKEHEDFAVQ